jgi:hypothetical protein
MKDNRACNLISFYIVLLFIAVICFLNVEQNAFLWQSIKIDIGFVIA